MQERRQHKRLTVEHVKVNGEIPLASDVKIMDLSMNGILVKADRRLNIGNKYSLKIGYKGKGLLVKATVMRCLLVESVKDADGNVKPIYLAGMQFTDVSNEKIEEIINFIEADTQVSCLNQILSESEIESSGEIIKKIEDTYVMYENKALSYYGILDIKNVATDNDIKGAYYKRAKEFHPDRHSYLPSDMTEKLNYIFAYLTEAYENLISPESKKKYDESLVAEKRVTVSNEELAREKFEKGKIEFWNENLAEAERFFETAVYLDNSSGRYFYFYAKTLLKIGKPEEAEKAVKRALNIDPLNPDYFVEAGYIYRALGMSHMAKEKFEKSLKLQPLNIEARKGLIGLASKKENREFRENTSNLVEAFKR